MSGQGVLAEPVALDGSVGDRARKAACVLAMLPPDVTAAILGASSPNQRQLFAQALLDVDAAAPDLVESASHEFISEVERINEEALGGIAALREKFRLDPPSSDSAVQASPPLPDLFGTLTVEEIADYLAAQRSLVAATLIQTLAPEMASEIFLRLPVDFANRVVADLARAPAIDAIRKAALFEAIVADLAARVAGPKDLGEGFSAVEALLPLIEAERRDDMLSHLAAHNPRARDKLRESLILFEELSTRLPEATATRIVAGIDKPTLLAALARADTASPATASFLLGGMSKRMREQIAEERDAAPAVAEAEQTAAERRLMAAVRQMIGEGLITPLRQAERQQ